MRVLMYAYGTRGDVEPVVALAQAVVRAGGEALVAVPETLRPWVQSTGTSVAGLTDEVLQRISSPDVRRMFEGAGSRRARRETARDLMHSSVAEYGSILADIAWIARESGPFDAVVHTQGLAEATHQVGEWLGVPSVLATLYPNYAPSGRYPSMLLAGATGTHRIVNRASHVVTNLIPPPTAFRRTLLRWRQERLGLDPRPGYWNFRRDSSGATKKILHAFSPTLMPPAAEWGREVSTQGFWFTAPADFEGRAELRRYVEAVRPVVVTLGSLRPSDEAGADLAVRRLAEDLQVRLLVVTGTSGFTYDESEFVRTIDTMPFSWALPRASAVIHAGGAGVSHHALRAGIPQIALPLHAEQLMWARSLAELGVSPQPVMMRDLTPVVLERVFTEASGSESIARAVKAAAQSVHQEQGADGAARDLARWAVR